MTTVDYELKIEKNNATLSMIGMSAYDQKKLAEYIRDTFLVDDAWYEQDNHVIRLRNEDTDNCIDKEIIETILDITSELGYDCN